MSQSRRWSAVEAVTNVAVGYALAIIVQAYLFPIFDFHASTGQHMAIAAVFTVVSLARSYAVRRTFNWWHHRD